MANQEARRDAVEEVMTAVMSGKIGAIARHFYPGAVVSQRSNAALSGEPWFERMEGEFQLRGEGETRAFIEELLKRSSYLTFELRGVICEPLRLVAPGRQLRCPPHGYDHVLVWLHRGRPYSHPGDAGCDSFGHPDEARPERRLNRVARGQSFLRRAVRWPE